MASLQSMIFASTRRKFASFRRAAPLALLALICMMTASGFLLAAICIWLAAKFSAATAATVIGSSLLLVALICVAVARRFAKAMPLAAGTPAPAVSGVAILAVLADIVRGSASGSETAALSEGMRAIRESRPVELAALAFVVGVLIGGRTVVEKRKKSD